MLFRQERRSAKWWTIGFFFLITLTLIPVKHRVAHAVEGFANAETINIGSSVEGQAIQAFRLGNGHRSVVLIGAIHGNEKNSAVLTRDLGNYFAANLNLLPPDTSLYLIPILNLDGFRAGTRYNAHGVDLNRNWPSHDWQSNTDDGTGLKVGAGGSAPFSEPETAALAAWLLKLRDQTNGKLKVLFYHAAYPPAGLVLSGSVGETVTRPIAAILGYKMAGEEGWTAYPVTGMAIQWCADQAIGCFEIELPNRANLAEEKTKLHAMAVLSVLLWEQMHPDQKCFLETGFCIAGRIRQFWQQNGGLAVFGLPISLQREEKVNGIPQQVQWFERNRLELHPGDLVMLGRLGEEYLQRQGRDWWLFPRATPTNNSTCRFFAESQHSICGEMLAAWRSKGLRIDAQRDSKNFSEAENLALLGLPLSEAQNETLSNGQTYTVQWFERARLELHPATAQSPAAVQLGLLGTEMQPK